MTDIPPPVMPPNRFRWFAAGSLTAVAAISGFLYTTGYFSSPMQAQAEAGRTIIEGKR